MSSPVFGVYGIINDRRVKPESVALFAMVEGRFKCRPATASTAATTTPAATAGLLPVPVFGGLGRLRFALGERGL